jgi:hypothetical protein
LLEPFLPHTIKGPMASSFPFIKTTIAFVIGMGMSHLLSASLDLFHFRRRMRLSWLPILWSISIFLLQIDLWWTIIGIEHAVEQWTLGRFLLLLSLTITLYGSIALIYPRHLAADATSWGEVFERDGRWGLLFLVVNGLLALFFDLVILDQELVSVGSVINLILSGLALGAFLARGLRLRMTLSLCFLCVMVLVTLLMAQASLGA